MHPQQFPELSKEQWQFLALLYLWEKPVSIQIAGDLVPILTGPLFSLFKTGKKQGWLFQNNENHFPIGSNLPVKIKEKIQLTNSPEHAACLLEKLKETDHSHQVPLAVKLRLFELAPKKAEAGVILKEMAETSANRKNIEAARDYTIQAKLLRSIQEHRFNRIGGNKTIHSDFRLITAANRDLQSAINRGQFRKDLYFRLSVVPFELPPLKDRRDDISLLTRHFFTYFSKKHNRDDLTLDKETKDGLMSYSWPGNIRELQHVIERAVLCLPTAVCK